MVYEAFKGRIVPIRYAPDTRHSPGLTKELERVAPNQPMSLDWVLEMAEKAGLTAGDVYLPGWSPKIPRVELTDGDVTEVFTADGTTVVWNPHFQSGKTEFHMAPRMRVQGHGQAKLGDRLLTAAEIFPRTATLREAMIYLTPPDWVVKVIREGRYTVSADLLCLESEVHEYVWSYLKHIQ